MHRLEAVLTRISLWMSRIGGLCLLAAAVLIAFEILARKFLLLPFNVGTELAAYALAIGASWSFAYALLHRAHVRIDVIYRRVEDDGTDPIEISNTGGPGVPGLLMAVANGGLVLANAHGSGVIEDPALAALWPDAAEASTGSSLRLPQIGDAARTVRLAEMPTFRNGELDQRRQ